jgi:hypothetical protein
MTTDFFHRGFFVQLGIIFDVCLEGTIIPGKRESHIMIDLGKILFILEVLQQHRGIEQGKTAIFLIIG